MEGVSAEERFEKIRFGHYLCELKGSGLHSAGCVEAPLPAKPKYGMGLCKHCKKGEATVWAPGYEWHCRGCHRAWLLAFDQEFLLPWTQLKVEPAERVN
jgi:hypothetical protein